MLDDTQVRRVEPDITVVAIHGRVTVGNTLVSLEAGMLRLIDEGARKLVIDLTKVEHMDSAGIGMLVGCNSRIASVGGRMRIVGAHGAVAKAFGVVRMERIAALDADVESACRHLSEAAS